MDVQIWCLLAGVMLPYIWAGASVPFRSQQLGTIDLNLPRHQAERLVDRGAAAVGAQGNAWEALAVFSVANLAAFMAGADVTGSWATAAMAWVPLRLLHGVFYIANIAVLRILCFAGGMGCSFYIFYQAFGALTA